MNNNFDEHNEEDYQPQQHMTSHNHHHTTNPRNVIEIPVQHIKTSTSPNPGAHSNHPNGQQQQPSQQQQQQDHRNHFPSEKFGQKNPDFFGGNRGNQSSIFDDFNSPFDKSFDLPSQFKRSQFNREPAFGSRFDEFLNPQGSSPIREIFRQKSPIPPSLSEQERLGRHSPTVGQRNESPRRTESPHTYQPGFKIPIHHHSFGSDFQRNESPNRHTPTPPEHHQQHNHPKQASPPVQQQQPKQTPRPPIVLPEPPQKFPKHDIKSDFINKTQQNQHNLTAEQLHQSRFTDGQQTANNKPVITINKTAPTPVTTPAKHTHVFKEQPIINLPKVIPLPQPEPHPVKPQHHTDTHQDQDEMGNTFQGSSTTAKRHAGPRSDFSQSHENTHQGTPPPAECCQQMPHVPVPKTQLEKLDDIAKELEDYQNELTTIKPGCGKKDKLYLKLDEFLTRCLLKLDLIEKTDDIIALRKSLIVTSNMLIDQLESVALDDTIQSNNSGEIATSMMETENTSDLVAAKNESDISDSNKAEENSSKPHA